MTSAEIFDAGYAVPMYDINAGRITWRYRNEDIETRGGAVPYHDLPGLHFRVGRIEDVRKAASVRK